MIWPFKKRDKGWDERDLESVLDKYWNEITRPDAIIEVTERECRALNAHTLAVWEAQQKAKASA